MPSIQIPTTTDAVVAELGGIGELLRATEWSRAALLASVVRLDQPQPGRQGRTGNGAIPRYFTPKEFAALRVVGLLSDNTVRLYVQRWLDAHEGKYPKLGAKVRLPKDDWPPTRTGTDGYESEAGLARTVGRLVETHGAAAVGKALPREAAEAAIDTHYPPPPLKPGTEVIPGESEADTRFRLQGALHRIDANIAYLRAVIRDTDRKTVQRMLDAMQECHDHLGMVIAEAKGEPTDEELIRFLESQGQS